MNPAILTILKLLGQAAIALLMQLLAGKTFKKLFLLPFEALAKKTDTKIDDDLIQKAEEDLGLPKDPNFGEGEK